MKIEIDTEDLIKLMKEFKKEITDFPEEELLSEIESHLMHFKEDFESLEITEW